MAWYVPVRRQGVRGPHRCGPGRLIVVGESTIEAAIQKAQLKAEKRVAKELNVNTKDIDKAVQDSKGP